MKCWFSFFYQFYRKLHALVHTHLPSQTFYPTRRLLSRVTSCDAASRFGQRHTEWTTGEVSLALQVRFPKAVYSLVGSQEFIKLHISSVPFEPIPISAAFLFKELSKKFVCTTLDSLDNFVEIDHPYIVDIMLQLLAVAMNYP